MRTYLSSLKVFIFVSFLIFAFSAVSGYFSAESSPRETGLFLEQVEEAYRPVLEMNPWQQFFSVAVNNGFTLFLVFLLGALLGIFPFLVLLSNGFLLGVVAYFVQNEFAWSTFLLGTLPHGIIEIPVLIVAAAIGLKLGKCAFGKIFRKRGGFRNELFSASRFFLKILLPSLVAAAAVEIFLTSRLLQ